MLIVFIQSYLYILYHGQYQNTWKNKATKQPAITNFRIVQSYGYKAWIRV